MLRAIAFAALVPILIVVLWNDAPGGVILLGWLVGFGLLAVAWWSGRLVLRCPYCRKRVKIGASTCHHCGQYVWLDQTAGGADAAAGVASEFRPSRRECPHCGKRMRGNASLCEHCGRTSAAWKAKASRRSSKP